jgi:tRNA A37 methylthiotransferase MiaB
MEPIADEIRWLAERGTKEITFLGQIVNNYDTHQMSFINGENPFVQL